jgi:hypothetical protein
MKTTNMRKARAASTYRGARRNRYRDGNEIREWRKGPYDQLPPKVVGTNKDGTDKIRIGTVRHHSIIPVIS